ncbi:MAG: hypothetical protein KME57_28275 [Scytonema hyalinum WJT4-NPBG1]|jgi:hypothetical protein|nr:hypothetical protein [Scytonema hyalinum WJT4-NPBG1]
MPTDNPRVAAYLPPPVFKQLKGFCKENRLSISEGVGRILGEYFGILPADTPSSIDWEARLTTVEGELLKLTDVGERIAAVENAIATLQQMISELQS